MITIAELRARNNKMTQGKLANELGVQQETVSRWEKDISRISAINLKKICLFFGASSDEILGIDYEDKKISI